MCEICGRIHGHAFRCPNYIPTEAKYYCSTCGQGILNNDEYIQNNDGDYRHYDCISGLKDLLQWLGYEVKTMTINYK